MRSRTKFALLVGGLIGHLAMTLISVSQSIDCGIQENCLTPLDQAWNKALSFPVFSALKLLNPVGHSSGTMLTLLIPLNSLAFVVVVYLLLKAVKHAREALGASSILK
jgi:hypothetical protein